MQIPISDEARRQKKIVRKDGSVWVRTKDTQDMPAVWNITFATRSKERTGWPTQKPLALLERIIKASSNKGDLVLDPFCGCMTTCIAAEKLGRQWVGMDVAHEAWTQLQARLKRDLPEEMPRGKPILLRDPPVRGADDARLQKYVYVISNPAFAGMFKVGVAANAAARLRQYQTSDPYRSYKLEFKLLTAAYAALEKYIHRKFGGNHEWVPGQLADIISAMENYRPEQDDAIEFDEK